MPSTLKHRSLVGSVQLSPDELNGVLANARALQRAAQSGATRPLLRGKNFGMLCEANDGDAALFRSAAVELGGHVSHIRPSLTDLSTSDEVRTTARMLGRLYDAIECHGMSPTLVQQVGECAGVPVYEGIASPNHPTAHLAELLDAQSSPSDNRRFVLQAVLLSTVG
jgi:ornithine carbamoyltransferase